MSTLSPSRIASELEWLKANPHFDEKPATIEEFLGPDYLNCRKQTRDRLVKELVNLFGEEVDGYRIARVTRAIFTGAIGIGKTTMASIVLPYMVHWVLCLKNPQEFLGMMEGTRIAFMMMSTSESQAREVVFSDVKARIAHAPWFANKAIDPAFKNQIRFTDKDVWILPGDSKATSFEGYNILGGILDEADSHTVTKDKDYAELGYTAIENRMESRFEDLGFLLVIGQMKSSEGFAARKFREFQDREDAVAIRLTIWESRGWTHYADRRGHVEVFYYDTKRRKMVPEAVAKFLKDTDTLLKIPARFKPAFLTNPEAALKDLAGMPPRVEDPFISQMDRVTACRDGWIQRYDTDGEGPVDENNRFRSWFRAPDTLPRVVCVDIAYSAKGDSLGLAMGHSPGTITVDDEEKPLIIFDFVMRIKALPGTEIQLSDIRKIIYSLRDHYRFNVAAVRLDGFQSVDMRQQLIKKRFDAQQYSVDKEKTPYYDLRDATYDVRALFPPYICEVQTAEGSKLVEIVVSEFEGLKENPQKIDHPKDGSKDVTDTMAGVVHVIMSNTRKYSRKITNMAAYREVQAAASSASSSSHPASTVRAPLPPPRTIREVSTMKTLLGPDGRTPAAEYRKSPPPQSGDVFGKWAGHTSIYHHQLPNGSVISFDLEKLALPDFRNMRTHYQINASLTVLSFMIHQLDWSIQCSNERARRILDAIIRERWTQIVRGFSQSFWAGYSPMVLQFENNPASGFTELGTVKDLVPEECRVEWEEYEGYVPPGSNTMPPKLRRYGGFQQAGVPYPYPRDNTVWYPVQMENGNYEGRKLLKPAFVPWFFSQLVHLYANRYYERFGEPTPKGRANFDEEVKWSETEVITGREAMQRMLEDLRNRSVIVLPNSTSGLSDGSNKVVYDFDVEYLESALRGADFEKYLGRLDEEMSLGLFTPILLFRTADVGSYNLGQGHMQVFMWMLNALAGDMKFYIDHFIVKRLKNFNFGPNAPVATWNFKQLGRGSLTMVENVLTTLINTGRVQPDLEELGQAVGLSLTEVKQVSQPSADPPPPPAEGGTTTARIKQVVEQAWGMGNFSILAGLPARTEVGRMILSELAKSDEWDYDHPTDLMMHVEMALAS